MYKIICRITLYIVLINFTFCQEYVGLNQGDFCTFKSSGKTGTCQLIDNCPAAIQSVKIEKILPQTCSFLGKQAIVCCQLSDVVTTTKSSASVEYASKTTVSTVTMSPTKKTTKPNSSGIGEKSKAKCKEYEKYAYTSSVVGQSSRCDDRVTSLLPFGSSRLPEFAHLAIIGFERDGRIEWLCGGSLISDQFVLIPAHCSHSRAYGNPKYVKIGDLDSDNEREANSQQFNIIETIRHPAYRPPSLYNGIALIKLDQHARFDNRTRPACLETNNFLNSTAKLIATGLERTAWSQSAQERPYKLILKYVTNDNCNISYKDAIGRKLKDGIVESSQICASELYESKDSCQGDFGGLLQTYNTELRCMYNIIGVTSIGKTCGGNIPRVYTRVSNYIEWIEGIVWT